MNTTELIESVKDRAAMPTSQNLFTPERIVRMLNDEMETAILPMMLRIQEDFYLTYEDFPSSQDVIQIPHDAIGQKVRSVGLYANGKLAQPLPRLEEINQAAQWVAGFILENYSIKLIGVSNSNAVIRVHYYRMPSKLTIESSVSKITQIDLLLNQVSLQAVPIPFVVGAFLDSSSTRNPHNLKAKEIEILAITGNIIDVPNSSLLEVGDTLALSGYSFFPNAPTEIHKLLAQRVAVKALESQGKTTEMAGAMSIYKQMENDILYILTPRSDGTAKKLIPQRGISSWV